MRWSGHIFAPPPPQLDCAPGSSGRWLAALGRAAWRRCGEEGSRGHCRYRHWGLETAGAVFWVEARVPSPVSADCQLLLSGFIILEIMHRHAAGGGAQAWPAGWRDYCIRKKPALGQRERGRGCPCPPAAKLVTKPPPAALI